MTTVGYIWQEVMKLARASDNDDLAAMRGSCQLAYYNLWGMLPWEAGRRKLSATLSSAASYLLPANLVGIEAVWDNTNEVGYFPGTRWGKIIRPTWFFLDPVEDALALLSNITIKNLANVWTGGT